MISKIRLLSILMGFFLLGGLTGFCQPPKGIDIGKLYKVAIEKYLLTSIDDSESIFYLEKPSFDTEYSIRLNEFIDSIKLEVILFKESYWLQLFRHVKEYQNADFEPEVDHYSVSVSERFKKKMEYVFSLTINSKLERTSSPDEDPKIHDGTTHKYRTFDGTTYLFRLKNGVNSSVEFEDPKLNTAPFKTAAICSTIAKSLKNNNFNESKIIEAINEAGY